MARTRETEEGDLAANANVVLLDGVHYQTTYSGFHHIKSITDLSGPGFHSRQKCGEFLPLNPALITDYLETRTPGVVDSSNVASGQHFAGLWYAKDAWHLPIPPPNEALTDAATLAAASNAAAGDFDALTSLAEIRKSMATVATCGSGFFRAVETIAMQARQARRNPWKKFQELWLGARYGVRPLIYDARNAASAIRRIHSQRKFNRGRGTEQESYNHSFDSGMLYFNGYYNYRVRETLNLHYTHRGVAYVDFKSALDGAVQLDPLVTAWELTPWTFVSDWFIDVGAWIQTIRPRLTGGFAGIGCSVKTVSTHKQLYELVGNGYADGHWGPAETTIVREEYTRSPTDVPFPPFVPKLDIPKVVDLATLFLRGKSRVNRQLSQFEK